MAEQKTELAWADLIREGRLARGEAVEEPIPVDPRDVRRRDLLGGLVHEYHGAAA